VLLQEKQHSLFPHHSAVPSDTVFSDMFWMKGFFIYPVKFETTYDQQCRNRGTWPVDVRI